MNKFRICLRMAILLLAPTLMGISGVVSLGCGLFSESEDVTPPPAGKVSLSENYSLNRAETGISFETITSPSQGYKGNATLGGLFSEGISASDSYRIVHTMNGGVIVSP